MRKTTKCKKKGAGFYLKPYKGKGFYLKPYVGKGINFIIKRNDRKIKKSQKRKRNTKHNHR